MKVEKQMPKKTVSKAKKKPARKVTAKKKTAKRKKSPAKKKAKKAGSKKSKAHAAPLELQTAPTAELDPLPPSTSVPVQADNGDDGVEANPLT